ncbi:hypothetical protein QFC20_001689 [Naganishia adeliensis]|uniref:Uncharacterized protein n=1 Tax=Naganishia adeliensis TaxID=92952 RepID=A0ACC2WQU9_9TREE|nr:hypothetical protein QFC20_001689 [Naganishia adeliensis]
MSGEEYAQGEADQPVFASLQEEADYFRAQYETTVQKVEEIQAESQTLDELIETLNGLNQNLEESNEALEQRHKEDQEDITALEKQVNQLEQQLTKTREELEELKQKRVQEVKEQNANVSTMQRKIENLEKEVEDRKQAIVKLEMGNDDLERSQRNALSSFLDLESQHNRMLEEKILLEQDLEGKRQLEEDMQRLKDELRDQTLETAILKTQLERAQAEMKVLTEQTAVTQPSPAIRITKSQSSASLSTPPGTAMRHTFMSPVAEQSMEESPATSIMTNSTIKADTGASPSQIPVARLKRLDSLSSTSSPTSPSLRRSNTLDSPRSSPQGRMPLSPSRYGISSNLNRSTNSRNIASLVSAGSPAPLKYPSTHRNMGTSTPLRPAALRKGSDASSVYAAKRQEISSKTANLVARLQGISAAHKTVVRKTSGSFQRVAHGVASAISHGNNRLNRSVSQQSDQSEQQTGHAVPGIVQGDISTVSTNSPGSWVVIKDQHGESSHHDSGKAGRQGYRTTILPPGDDNNTLKPHSVLRSGKMLPARPGIPSPLNQSMSGSASRSNLALPNRSLRLASNASNTTTISSSTSDSNRPMTPVGESRVPAYTRPASSMSQRESDHDDWASSDMRAGNATVTVDKPLSARLVRPHGATYERPRSRQDDHQLSSRQTRLPGNLQPIAPPPSRHPGVTTRSNRRIEPPARPTTKEQQDLPPRTSSVRTQPRVSRRQVPAQQKPVAAVGGSGIPRRSVSGRRPVSMSVVPQEVPPLPEGALAHVEAGRRAAGIGIGLPSSPRKTGLR